MNSITMRAALTAALAVGALCATVATASAAAPTASTGGESRVTANSVRLSRTVNPRGLSTSYYFEYGTTRRYGSRTPDQSAGRGTSNRTVVARRRRPAAEHDLQLPHRRQQPGRRHQRREPHVPHPPPAARPLARGRANPVTFGQGTTLAGAADRHGQRRPPGRPRAARLPVHVGLRPGRQPGRHRRQRRLHVRLAGAARDDAAARAHGQRDQPGRDGRGRGARRHAACRPPACGAVASSGSRA